MELFFYNIDIYLIYDIKIVWYNDWKIFSIKITLKFKGRNDNTFFKIDNINKVTKLLKNKKDVKLELIDKICKYIVVYLIIT